MLSFQRVGIDHCMVSQITFQYFEHLQVVCPELGALVWWTALSIIDPFQVFPHFLYRHIGNPQTQNP